MPMLSRISQAGWILKSSLLKRDPIALRQRKYVSGKGLVPFFFFFSHPKHRFYRKEVWDMLFKIMLALAGYYIGRTGMDLDSFLALIEAIIRGNNEDE